MTQFEHHEKLCESCPAGKVPSSLSGATSCTDCTYGKFYSSDGICEACPSGKYSNQDTASECLMCIAGKSTTTPQAAQGCTVCASGKYSYDGAMACCPSGSKLVTYPTPKCEAITCNAGYYFGIVAFQPSMINSEIVYIPDCVRCPAGKYSDKISLSSDITNVCQQCDPGKYASMAGAIGCVECPAGKYMNSSGASTCVDCLSGRVSGAKLCLPCPNNSISVRSSDPGACVCKAGYLPQSKGLEGCVACPKGKYSAEGDTVCSVCVAGKYSDIGPDFSAPQAPEQIVITVSNLICRTEFAGTYRFFQFDANDIAQYISLHSTSSGHVMLSRSYFGGVSQWTMTDNKLYAYAVDNGVIPSRTSGTLGGSPQWVEACTSGTGTKSMIDETYSSLLLNTNERVDNAGSSSCTDCAAGKFSALPEQKTSNACGMCVIGKYSLAASSVCTDCPSGKYSDKQGEGSTSCINCIAGEYKTMPGAGVCNKCSRGSYSAEAGAAACDQCQSGKHSAETGLSVCIDCVAGKYSTSGQTRCEDCPSNSTSPAGSAANECVCDAGYEPVLPTGSATVSMPLKCSACAPGKFKSRSSIAPAVAHVNYIDFEKCSTCVEGLYAAHREDPDDPYEA